MPDLVKEAEGLKPDWPVEERVAIYMGNGQWRIDYWRQEPTYRYIARSETVGSVPSL